MLRFLLHYVVPLVLPVVVYFGCVALFRGRGPGWLQDAPWALLASAGVALLAISLVTFGLLSGAPPENTYLPARFEDGRVVPARSIEP